MKNSQNKVIPEARKEEIVIREVSDEVLVYDLKRHKAHCLNKTAALIWEKCDGRTSVGEMNRQLRHELQAEIDDEMIWFTLDSLGKAHLLQEKVTDSDQVINTSRRDLVKKLGVSAALAVPVVMSISSPTAAQSGSIISPSQCNSDPVGNAGRCCNNNKRCIGSGCGGAAC